MKILTSEKLRLLKKQHAFCIAVPEHDAVCQMKIEEDLGE